MLQDQEPSIAIRKDFAEKQHKSRKAWLRERDVSTQTANLLPVDPNADMPTPIALELECFATAEEHKRNVIVARMHVRYSRTCG